MKIEFDDDAGIGKDHGLSARYITRLKRFVKWGRWRRLGFVLMHCGLVPLYCLLAPFIGMILLFMWVRDWLDDDRSHEEYIRNKLRTIGER